jgi:hypothetical protein
LLFVTSRHKQFFELSMEEKQKNSEKVDDTDKEGKRVSLAANF